MPHGISFYLIREYLQKKDQKDQKKSINDKSS